MPTLGEIQETARRLSHDRGWPDKTPSERMLYIISEVGELAAALVDSEDTERGPGAIEAIALEIYDVIWNACDLARLLGIDLDAAADRKARINEGRTW